MAKSEMTHEGVIAAIQRKLEPIEHIHGMWEIGAAAFSRVDEWSDIDLQICGDDDKIEEIIRMLEEVLEELSPIESQWRLPEPTPHGHAQVFYKLRDASPFLLIDVVIMKASAKDKFLVPEIHNPPTICFDKNNCTAYEPFDPKEFLKKLKGRAALIKSLFSMFQVMTLKEINRNHPIEAISYYQAYTLRWLVELQRIRYRPTRYNFSIRYLYDEFPEDVLKRLEPLYFIKNLEDLQKKRESAEELFFETYAALDWGVISKMLNDAAKVRNQSVDVVSKTS
ncbi:nucleotidyltransferase domain-containing protein [Candidatus Acetothermia bacterium]|nr:nucleotidyltransferase domain-containing protein [Candidatus Acetothermia bacterium]MBI3643576.1 nucleotidyltransferase domain-containing protein [Candidatus Acetothermia bacterium]